MTRDDYIFTNAPRIAERQIRVARSLQSNEAKRMCIEMLAAIEHWAKRVTGALNGGKSSTL